jgi:hypothetical protein
VNLSPICVKDATEEISPSCRTIDPSQVPASGDLNIFMQHLEKVHDFINFVALSVELSLPSDWDFANVSSILPVPSIPARDGRRYICQFAFHNRAFVYKRKSLHPHLVSHLQRQSGNKLNR